MALPATGGAAVASGSGHEMTELDELLGHLRVMRGDLVTRMSADLAAGVDVHSWLATLAQIHAAVEAVEAVEPPDGD